MPTAETPAPSVAVSDRGHPLPRRSSPEASVTLQHHRLAQNASILRARRDATTKALQKDGHAVVNKQDSESPRRMSSGESHITGKSDPKKWFDRSNKNPAAEYGRSGMEIDSPFFQKDSDDSNNESLRKQRPVAFYGGLIPPGGLPLAATQSSSEDFRSIVDDLTVENKRLKEELKKYKQFGPGLMRKDKLFEIKVHGLPARKKRELEATLRDFAASLGGSSEGASPKRKSKHSPRLHNSTSKHPSSSSSNSRPVDSAYASMSTGKGSSSASMHRPNIGRSHTSDQKVENYLDDIPAGLYPGLNPMALNESDKARLIVKKLEQLFTGRITGRLLGRHYSAEVIPSINLTQLPEPAREAIIQQQLNSGMKQRSRENLSSNSNPESGGNDTGSGSGENSVRNSAFKSPPDTGPLPEQRPTRPRDLDPDRPQVPSENMDYIRHLGLVPPELLAGTKAKQHDVSPDAEGWVYLNLLANLAQLHILNVSPDFIRRAVREKSTKFQVSSDGRKIRWRGGTEGTKFSSDSSGEASGERSPASDDGDDGSDENGQRKRQRMDSSGPSVKKRSAMVPPAPRASESFHYKPMFLHKQSSGDSSREDSESQDSQRLDDSNWENGSRERSGSGSSPHRKRRADGAMVFYTGAPFCIDLSGDNGDGSPTTYLTSHGQQSSLETDASRPAQWRSLSGSSLAYRPLIDTLSWRQQNSADTMDPGSSGSPSHSIESNTTEDKDLECDFAWSKGPQLALNRLLKPQLEPSGIGGVFPEDHFAVYVTTRRPRDGISKRSALVRKITDESNKTNETNETTKTLLPSMARMSTLSPRKEYGNNKPPILKIHYLSGKVHRLEPMPLPPPLHFVPPVTESSDTTDYGESTGSQLDEMDDDQEVFISSSSDVLSLKANPHLSDNPTDLDEPNTSSEVSNHEPRSAKLKSRPSRLGRGEIAANKVNADSSVATVGGPESGYSSSSKEI